jgi:hypothetical protein
VEEVNQTAEASYVMWRSRTLWWCSLWDSAKLCRMSPDELT